MTTRQSTYTERGKVWLDRLLAAVALVILSPFLALIALLVKLDSRGPAIYSQIRVGKNRRTGNRRANRNREQGPYAGPDRRQAHDDGRRQQDFGGKPFRIYKFRTMYIDAEQREGAQWCSGATDPRITRIGRILRPTHLDELPQLINVLRGEMSIVGPRPERPEFCVRLQEYIPAYRQRTTVRPGLTGLAQVQHRYDSSVDDVKTKVDFDLAYIQRLSPWMDMQIIFGTVGKCWREFHEWRAARAQQHTQRQSPPVAATSVRAESNRHHPVEPALP